MGISKLCSSGSKCVGRDDGRPASLRSVASIDSGFCSECRSRGYAGYSNGSYGSAGLYVSSDPRLSTSPASSAAARVASPSDAKIDFPEMGQKDAVRGDPFKTGGSRLVFSTAEPNSLYPRPSDSYQAVVMDMAAKLSGRPVDSYESAVSIVAANARERVDLNRVSDLADLMDTFDAMEKRHSGIESLTIASVLLLNQPVIVTNKTGAGVEAVMRTAGEENMEIQIIKSPREGQSQSDVRAAVRKLALQSSKIPSSSSGGIVVLVTDVSKAHHEFKNELITAMINRRIGPFPVPAGVHFAVAETGAFSVDDFPTEVLMQAISVNVKGRDDNAIEEITRAADTRRSVLERALAAAAGDEQKTKRIKERMNKTGYVGAFDMAAGMTAKGQEAVMRKEEALRYEGVPIAGKLAAMGYANRSAATSTDKAVIVTEVVQPELSELRREVAFRLLSGIGGVDFAKKGLSNYERRNDHSEVLLPSLDELISGTKTDADVRAALERGGKVYAASLAAEMRESPMVEDAMKRGGGVAERLVLTFSAIFEYDRDIGKALAKSKPVILGQ